MKNLRLAAAAAAAALLASCAAGPPPLADPGWRRDIEVGDRARLVFEVVFVDRRFVALLRDGAPALAA